MPSSPSAHDQCAGSCVIADFGLSKIIPSLEAVDIPANAFSMSRSDSGWSSASGRESPPIRKQPSSPQQFPATPASTLDTNSIFSPSSESQQATFCFKTLCGSPLYVAPELCQPPWLSPAERGYGLRVDIWAVGVMTVALLVNAFPFTGDTTEEIMQKVRIDCVLGHLACARCQLTFPDARWPRASTPHFLTLTPSRAGPSAGWAASSCRAC